MQETANQDWSAPPPPCCPAPRPAPSRRPAPRPTPSLANCPAPSLAAPPIAPPRTPDAWQPWERGASHSTRGPQRLVLQLGHASSHPAPKVGRSPRGWAGPGGWRRAKWLGRRPLTSPHAPRQRLRARALRPAPEGGTQPPLGFPGWRRNPAPLLLVGRNGRLRSPLRPQFPSLNRRPWSLRSRLWRKPPASLPLRSRSFPHSRGRPHPASSARSFAPPPRKEPPGSPHAPVPERPAGSAVRPSLPAARGRPPSPPPSPKPPPCPGPSPSCAPRPGSRFSQPSPSRNTPGTLRGALLGGGQGRVEYVMGKISVSGKLNHRVVVVF